jgi:hypothetical protein
MGLLASWTLYAVARVRGWQGWNCRQDESVQLNGRIDAISEGGTVKRTIVFSMAFIICLEVLAYLSWYGFYPRNRYWVKFEGDSTRICLSQYKWDGVMTACSSPIQVAWMPIPPDDYPVIQQIGPVRGCPGMVCGSNAWGTGINENVNTTPPAAAGDEKGKPNLGTRDQTIEKENK